MAVDVSALQAALISAGEQIVDSAANALMRDISATDAPIDEGELVESGQVTSAGLVATLAYTAEHAIFNQTGTGPHLIEGNPLLAFESGGQTVIVPFVNHPGSTKNKGWFDKAESQSDWEEVLQAALDSTDISG